MSHYFIDGRTLSDLIYASTAFDGGLAPAVPQRTLEETAYGPPRLTARHRLVGRTLTIAVDVRPSTLPLRSTVLDTLTRRLAGVREVVVEDAPARAWYGEVSAIRAKPTAVNSGNPLTLVEIDVAVADPRRHDRETQLLALTATPTPIPTGTGTSALRVRLFGDATPVVNPQIVLRAPSGAELTRLTLTGSLGANTWLDVDSASEWLHLVSSGTRTVALSWLTSGAFPMLDGADAAGPDGPFPTLALESASGTPTGVVLWRRSWH
jgi:hypothetical protein